MRDLRAVLQAMPGVDERHGRDPASARRPRRRTRAGGPRRRLTDPTKFQQATTYFVLPGYFEAMRTRVIEGRTFSETDNTPDARRHRHRPHARVEGVPRAVRRRPHPPRARAHAGAGTLRGDRRRRSSAARVAGRRRTRSDVSDGRLRDVRRRQPLGRPDVGAIPPRSRRSCAPRSPSSTRAPASIEVQPMEVFVEQARAQTKFALILIGDLRRHRARARGGRALQRAVDRGPAAHRRRSACAWRSAPSTARSSG